MANILVTHEPFLYTRSQVLILPMSLDGTTANPVLGRCKSMFAGNHNRFERAVILGELGFSQVMVNKLERHHTGLGVPSGRTTHIANLVVHKSATQSVNLSTLKHCLQALRPQLQELMRYQGVRRVAFLASALQPTHHHTETKLVADDIVALWQAVFGSMAGLTVELYFHKDTPLPQKILENHA